MNKYSFIDKIKDIEDLDSLKMKDAKDYLDNLAKPIGSLGKLEEIAIKFSGITSNIHNEVRACLNVYASDNGVVKENVSSTPQSVTFKQAINIKKGKSGAGCLASYYHYDINVYDLGIIGNTKSYGIIDKKIRESTDDIYLGPAMNKDECLQAIQNGFDSIEELKDKYNVFGIGEMGIGNTTTSSAILHVLSGLKVEDVTGKGAGLTEEAYLHKIEVIKEAVRVNKVNKDDVYDVLHKLGGFDICAMVGAYLACAYYKKIAVIDGFISALAAYVAYKINNKVALYLIASHKSFEIGFEHIMQEMNMHAYLDLNMRLGEGSGCPLCFELIKASCAIMNNMSTFKEANINNDYIEELKQGDKFTVK
ncbi:MAG: nicotinate-nucleotide--dimethylbenzimidazole phosphoribosyltransferase [Bacilli bacterium]|nr:nicotinate-nucleotide--dimethylbenzimidazole phosphoribosyltransferase [Bacilli bacterium]